MRSISFSFALYVFALMIVRHSRPDAILFYQGIVLALVVAVIHGGLAWRFAKPRIGLTALKDALLVFLLAYSFMFTVPTTVDRSYTIRMLGVLDGAPSGMTREELAKHFGVYFAEHGGVDRRIAEQIDTGTLAAHGERIQLTPFGHLLTKAFALNCRLFACRQ